MMIMSRLQCRLRMSRVPGNGPAWRLADSSSTFQDKDKELEGRAVHLLFCCAEQGAKGKGGGLASRVVATFCKACDRTGTERTHEYGYEL